MEEIKSNASMCQGISNLNFMLEKANKEEAYRSMNTQGKSVNPKSRFMRTRSTLLQGWQ